MWFCATILHTHVDIYLYIIWRCQVTYCQMLLWINVKQPWLVVSPLPETPYNFYQILVYYSHDMFSSCEHILEALFPQAFASWILRHQCCDFSLPKHKKSPINSFVQLNSFVFEGNIEKKTTKPCNSAPYMSLNDVHWKTHWKRTIRYQSDTYTYTKSLPSSKRITPSLHLTNKFGPYWLSFWGQLTEVKAWQT